MSAGISNPGAATLSPIQTSGGDLNLNVNSGAGDSSIPLIPGLGPNNNGTEDPSNGGKDRSIGNQQDPKCHLGIRAQTAESEVIPMVIHPTSAKMKKAGLLDNRLVTCAQSFIHKSLYISILILILAQATLLGGWIHLYDFINSTMARTFSWRALLSPFGAIFEYTQCVPDPLKSSRTCPINNSPPAVPIVGLIIATVQLVLAVFFMCFQRCRNSFVFYMKQLVFIEGLFVLFSSVVSISLILRNLDLLKDSMKEELNLSDNSSGSESSRWKITQTQNQCCGMNNASDWKSLPSSCCETTPCGETTAWKKGCYAIEYETIAFYGKIEVSMLVSIFLLGLAFFLFCKQFHASCKQFEALKEVSNHRIFMRQGSNFITFGGQGGNNHVIRKDGIMIDAKGALACSTGLNDNHISLETLNFSAKDQINVTRESDRIVITVTRGELMRGVAVITANEGQDLEKIIITPTPTGLLNIFG